MVDGYGDGLVIECGTEDSEYLRTTAFGLLQVRRACGCYAPSSRCLGGRLDRRVRAHRSCRWAAASMCGYMYVRFAPLLQNCRTVSHPPHLAPPPPPPPPQGCRMRNTKTEYVSCPSCGRTLFNLQARGHITLGGMQ